MPKHTPTSKSSDALPILPIDVPVEMPDLPMAVTITTLEQFKAISHPLRTRILGIIQQQPATAKQIADRLRASTGSIGHHLKLLEEAGLAQIVAKRVTHGIIAKYYTRTAKVFDFDLPKEWVSPHDVTEDIVGAGYADLQLTLTQLGAEVLSGYPRVKLSSQQVAKYQARVKQLIEDLLAETPDPNGAAWGLLVALFESPAYMQEETYLA